MNMTLTSTTLSAAALALGTVLTWRPFCQRAEQLLRSKGLSGLKKIAVDLEPGQMETMMARTGRRSVPQIFIGEVHVGGCDDLAALDRAGQLDALLQTTGANAP